MTWQEYISLPHCERGRPAIIKQLDPISQQAARRFYHPSAADRAESANRRRVINATTQEEINRHCVFPPALRGRK